MDRYSLYFDGASKGNPGEASYGFLIKNEKGETIFTKCKKLGINTNNFAEYSGVMDGIKKCIKLEIKKLDVYGDSNLVIKQLKEEWKVRNDVLKKFFNKIKKMEKDIEIRYFWIKREDNKEADEIANRFNKNK